jgi:hypothetical protein
MSDPADAVGTERDLFQHWQGDGDLVSEAEIGDRRRRGFYFDLVSVHVECGVLVFLILLMIGNALATGVLLVAYAKQDVYVIPGTKRNGTTALLWGRDLNERTRERILDMERLRREKLRERGPDLELDTEGLLQASSEVDTAAGALGQERLPAATGDDGDDD